MARAHRFTHSVLLGFLGQAAVMIAGLWLTPFLLRRLGSSLYGWWIVGQQLLVYLTLMDFGVVALLPRETAYLTGRGEALTELPALVRRTMRIVLTQAPLVTAAAGLLWLLIPSSLGHVRTAAGFAVAAFGFLFPLRIFRAVLEGLQDLAFISWTYMMSWAIGFLASVGLVACGFGLESLVAGWAASQAADGLLCLLRIRARFPYALRSKAGSRGSSGARQQFGRGLSVSISQIAQVLIYGTDAAIVGRLFGSAAVVPYNSTGKLIGVLSNQPQQIMRAAEPGLSQMRVAESRERLASVTSALSLAMLLASGLVTTFSLAVNPSFVRWWIGGRYFSGMLLSVLFALSMVLRHLNITAIYTLFAFGYEKRLAWTSLADGVLSTVFSIAFAYGLHSPAGVVLGSILSTCCVLVGGNARMLSRELEVPLADLVKPLLGWFWRMCLAASSACLLGSLWGEPAVWSMAISGVISVGVYAVLMIPVALRSSLRPYLLPYLARLARWWPLTAVPEQA